MCRADLHRILDEIPETEIPGVRRYLEYVRDVSLDPVQRALKNAPLDDESITNEESTRIVSANEDLNAGRTISTRQLKRSLGLNDTSNKREE